MPPPPPPPVRRSVVRGDILGQNAQALTARFGQTRIDLREGDARKLQFAGSSCILDIYLYPPQRGGQPVASHVDARLKEGGNAVQPSACAAEIARR